MKNQDHNTVKAIILHQQKTAATPPPIPPPTQYKMTSKELDVSK